MSNQIYKLTPEQIKAIEMTVAKGDRAEVVPVKGGLKILRATREEIKIENKTIE